MATNIEQIFRSFVVSKFREIQEQQQQQQQFGGGGKIGSQYNGEINSPEHISSSDDNIGSVGNLQNDPLVQKIEQVLSEVLSAESQYKPDGGEDAVRSKSRSVKRGLSEEVQDEIPRKKSKKDKKHKDKKKKKKRKKEKKHKKQSKESKLNDQQKECGDLQQVLHSELENPCFILSAGDDVNIESASVLQHASVSLQEKTAYENENSAMPNSHNTNSDSSRLDTSKEDSTLVSIHEPSEVKLVSERELESGTGKTIGLTLNLCIEDQSLRTAEAEGSSLSVVRDAVFCMEQSEISSTLEATEKLNVPENSSSSITVQPEYLETSLESNMIKVKSLDSVTNSLNLEGMKESAPTLLETPALPHLELSGEAKDSVTTLGFLAMVVGKDFEATSEFLNTAKVKASERSPKHISLTDMTDDNVSERLVTMQDLQKALQSRAEMKDSEAAPETQHVVSKNYFEPALVSELKPQQTDSRRMVEFGEHKCMAATADAEAIVREFRETQVSAIMMEPKDSEKYPRQLQIEKDAKNVSRMPELDMMNKTDLSTSLSNVGMETRTLDSVSGSEEIDFSCLKAKSATKKENWNTIPESFRMSLKNIAPLSKSEEAVKVNRSLEAVVEEKQVSEIAEHSEPVSEVKIPESISQTEAASETSDLETALGIGEIVKPQNWEVSQYASKIAESGMNLKDMKKVSESSVTLKNVETTSAPQYLKGMNYIQDTLQSDAVSRGRNLQANLEGEGKKEEKDVDATSESLHMIFTNYSEQNLELFSEPKVMMKLKSSDIVPQSSHMMDANSLESQHIRKAKDLKMVESEMMVGLNDLQKKIECLHRNVKIVEAALECKAVSHWTELEEKTSDTIENMMKERYSAGTDNLQISPRYEEVNNRSKTTTGNELTAESENLSLTSDFSKEIDMSSETAAELKALAVVQKLKESVGFTSRVEEDSPKETLELKSSVSTDLNDYSKSVNIVECFESISESRREENLQSLQDTTAKRKEVNLGSLCDLETEYAKTSSEFQFTGALTNQEEKQKFQERTEMTGLIASSESLYAPERDLIQVPECEENNDVESSESVCLAEPNSGNVPKSFYMIQVKNSKTTSESRIPDGEHLNTDSGSTLTAGVEMGENLPECVTMVVPGTEIILDTPNKNELLESQGISALQESESKIRNKASTLTNLEAYTETVCLSENKKLEIAPQHEESEVVKKPGDSSSLFVPHMVDIKTIPSFVHEAEDKESKVAKAAETVVTLAKSKGSKESVDIVKDTSTELSHDINANNTGTFKRSESAVVTQISESLLTTTGIPVEQDAKLVVTESVSDLVIGSEKEDCDPALTEFMMDVRIAEANTSILDTAERNTSKTALQFEATSKPPCIIDSMDLDDNVESQSKTETKDSRQVVNYVRPLEVKDSNFPVAISTQLITPQLKSSESVSVSKETDLAGILNLNPTPVYIGTTDFKSSSVVAETEVLEISDSEIHLKPGNNSEVKYFEAPSETENVLHKTVSISEREMEKFSELISDKVCPHKMKEVETILEPKHAQQTKALESSLQSVYTVGATDLEGSLISEVLGVSKTNQQFSGIVEKTDVRAAISSVTVEAVKETEKQLQLEPHFEGKCSESKLKSMHVSDLQDSYADEGPASLAGKKCPKPVTEVASVIDVKNSKSNLELALQLKDTETMFKPRSILESVQRKEQKDFEATSKCESFVEVKELQVTQTSTDKEQMDLGGMSKSVLTLESEHLGRNSTPVLFPEGKPPEGSLDTIHVQVKDSVVTPEYVSANNKEVSKVKIFESTAEHVIEARNSEIISQATVELKNSESALEALNIVKEKDLGSQIIVEEQGLKATVKPVCPVAEETLEVVQEITVGLTDPEPVLESAKMAEKDLKAGEQVIVEAKDSETTLKSTHITKEKDLETMVQDCLKDKDSEAVTEREGSILKDKKSEKISSKSKDKSKSKKAKKSRSKSPSKSKKRKKKSRSHSTTRQVSRRERSRSKHDSHSRKKHSTSHHKSRSKSTDKKEDKESSRSRRRRSRSKSRSKSVDRNETSAKSRRRRSRSSDHRKSRSRSIDKRESVRRRRRLSRSSDKQKSRSRSAERRETLIRSRRRRSRSSDHQKSRSRSADKRETSVRTRRRRSRSSDRYRSRSKSLDRRESSVRTRRRQSRSSDHHKSRSRSADDKKDISVRRRRRRSRSRDTRKSRSRSADRRETTVRARRRRSRSSDHHKSRSRSVDKRESSVRTRRRRSRSSDNCRSKSRSVDKRETSVRTRRRRSRSSDNRRSKSKSVDKRESSVKRRRRRSLSSDRKSRSKSVEKRETSVHVKRKRSRSSDTHKSRSKSVEASARSKRKRSKSVDHKSRAKSVEKEEPSLKSRRRKSKSSDRQISKSKSRSKSTERKKDKDSSDASKEKHSRYRSKSKSVEKAEESESLDVSGRNHAKSPEQHKSKSRSRSKSIDKMDERETLRRSKSKGSKSPEPRSRRRRTVSRSRRNRSRSLTRRRTSRSKSDHRSRTRSRSRSQSRSRRWRRTRSRSLSRQRSLSRERRRRSRRNRSRSPDRRRRRSDSRDSYRISLRLRSRSRTPARLRSSRSTGRRRSPSKSPDHRRSRSSSRSPKRLTDLDKAQLLEIAKANAAAMCAKAGVPLPPSLMPVITPEKKEEKVTQKSAKETILELTEKCKKIAQSQEDDVIVNKPHVSDEEEEEHPFINHPFKLNEPKPIFFNLTTPTIKPPPPKNQVTLTKEFPVSSGSQHRKKEADSAYGEWVPVEKNKDEKKDDVFPNPASLEPVDISSALNERTIAQKRLTENTFDLEAMCLLNRAQERIDAWAELNSIPGHFTGSTGAQVLSSEQLSNSGPQAWVKKDQFLRAAPVTGGMGAQLMRKMGWREGEGLGKNKEGNKEPILVDFKTDRKGLVAVGEKTQKRHGPFSAVKDLSGKHPVSALLEVCNKRRWSPPVFVLVNDNRPEYRKHFLFKVMVNGVEHKPTFVSPNKKHAKAMAATVALQALGLVPKDLFANATSFRSASHN